MVRGPVGHGMESCFRRSRWLRWSFMNCAFPSRSSICGCSEFGILDRRGVDFASGPRAVDGQPAQSAVSRKRPALRRLARRARGCAARTRRGGRFAGGRPIVAPADSRCARIVCAGFVVGAYEAYRMSQWTDRRARERRYCCRSFSSVSGSARSFRSLPHSASDRSAASGWASHASLFSVMINTGAAAGIAVATNLLTSGHARHRAQLLAALPTSNSLLSVPTNLSGPQSQLLSAPAHLISALESQAWLLAYNDVYRVTAVLLILLAPWAFLLKRAPVDTGATIVPE